MLNAVVLRGLGVCWMGMGDFSEVASTGAQPSANLPINSSLTIYPFSCSTLVKRFTKLD